MRWHRNAAAAAAAVFRRTRSVSMLTCCWGIMLHTLDDDDGGRPRDLHSTQHTLTIHARVLRLLTNVARESTPHGVVAWALCALCASIIGNNIEMLSKI